MGAEASIRRDFLDDFTKRIILTIEERKRIIKSLDIKNKIIIHPVPSVNRSAMPIQRTAVILPLPQKQIHPIYPVNQIINQIKPIQPNIQVNPIPLIPKDSLIDLAKNQDSMKKIYPFLSDPQVQSVECKGPGKPLLVLKRGIIQVTNIILTDEEINSLIKSVSEKTRIPIIPGLFKALFGNLIITAVISEFVGTRFIIEKRRN